MKISQSWIYGLGPDQVSALSLLLSKHHALISNNDSKQQALLAFAWALSNNLEGKKTIIASRDVSFIHSFFQKCIENDLGSLVYLKNDQQYVSAFQLARKKSSDPLEIKNQKFGLITGQKEFVDFSKRFKVLLKPIFGKFTWSDLCDRLASHKLSGRPNVLHLKLSPADFTYTIEEYKEIRQKVASYIKLSKINHPYFDILSHLNITNEKETSLQKIKQNILETLEHSTHAGESIIRTGEQLLLQFIKHTRNELKVILSESFKSIHDLKFKIDNYSHLLGQEFAHESSLSNLSTRIKSNFNRSSKDLIKSRRLVKSCYIDLLGNLSHLSNYLPNGALNPVESLSIEAIETHLNDLDQLIAECEQKMHRSVNEQVKRLNSKNISKDHPFKNALSNWETEVDNWALNMRQSNAFLRKIEINALSVEKKLEMAADEVRLLREIVKATEKIDDYIFWQLFQNNLTNKCQKVTKALEFEEAELWLDIFDQWYFHSLLEQNSLHEIPNENFATDQVQKLAYNNLKLIASLIKGQWQDVRYNEFRSPNKNLKPLQNAIKKKDQMSQQLALEHMSILDRVQLFPIQIVSTAQFSKENSVELNRDDIEVLYVLDANDTESANMLASTSRHSSCNIIAGNEMANRVIQTSMSARKVVFRTKEIHTESLDKVIPWQGVNSSEKLNYYSKIAMYFHPLISALNIYHTKDAQIFSFLGQKLNAWLLDELNEPYKIHADGLQPTKDFIIECLLDSKKPIVILTRDGMVIHKEINSYLFQQKMMQNFEGLGFPLYNSWSANWIENGQAQMNELQQWLNQHNRRKSVPLEV